MTTVYFVRHAESDYENHNDWERPLTEKGMADRKLVTEYLSGVPVDAVLSSPFRRAVETVEDFANSRGLAIEQVEAFQERKVDNGWIENFHAFSRKQWENFDYQLSNGETLREVQGRNIRALTEVLTRYAGKTVVIGSHGTALSTVIRFFRKDFGFAEFEAIRMVMPWVVRFCFEGTRCVKIEAHDVFTKQTREF